LHFKAAASRAVVRPSSFLFRPRGEDDRASQDHQHQQYACAERMSAKSKKMCQHHKSVPFKPITARAAQYCMVDKLTRTARDGYGERDI
jgi:hypothetical protein